MPLYPDEHHLVFYRRNLDFPIAHFLGVLFCITIIGIPFGMQHFKLAGLALTPFGHDVK